MEFVSILVKKKNNQGEKSMKEKRWLPAFSTLPSEFPKLWSVRIVTLVIYTTMGILQVSRT